jgi:DNA-directed RNA polymerase specialized sigma24 family protein
MTEGSITRCIADLKGGEGAAAERLWESYFPRMVGLIRARLAAAPRAAADEEDAALSAFQSLCAGAAEGRFPELRDRGSLWPLLVVLTVRKAQDQLKRGRRQKRGGGRAFDPVELDDLLSAEPSPDVVAAAMESCEGMLNRLEGPLREIATLKLSGHNNADVARQLGCGLRTVERRLELIRRIWEDCERGL